jgi:hypothetical protein
MLCKKINIQGERGSSPVTTSGQHTQPLTHTYRGQEWKRRLEKEIETRWKSTTRSHACRTTERMDPTREYKARSRPKANQTSKNQKLFF